MATQPATAFAWGLGAVCGWVGWWLYRTRDALLDDALIHLRYADYLHRVHFITFDGIHHTFGTSSLLYVALLALLRGISTSALLPKFVGDVVYVALLGVVLRQMWRTGGRARLIFAGLLLCLLSPMGVRWLTDGMETGITVLAAVLLALTLDATGSAEEVGGGRAAWLLALGAGLVLLRVELAIAVALGCVSLTAAELGRGRGWRRGMAGSCPLAAGGLAALIWVRLAMGSFVPDAASAKSYWYASYLPLVQAGHVLAAAVVFGLGTALCWVMSMVWACGWVRGRAQRVAFAAENGAPAVFLAVACARGQVVAGVRYLVWTLVLGIVANGLRLARTEDTEELSVRDRMVAAGFGVLLLCALPLDWKSAVRAMDGRARTFREMRDSRLGELFRGQPIVASDVGFISYFTGASTCDTEGLINGREAADESIEDRVRGCARTKPVMIFGTVGTLTLLREAMSLDGWKVCGVYDFTNVQTIDRHYVVVPADAASRVCEALHFVPLEAAGLGRPTL